MARVKMNRAISGLRRQMDNPFGASFLEGRCHRLRLSQIYFLKCELGVTAQQFQTRRFQVHVVIDIEVIPADDLIAAFEQPTRHMKTDKARRSGD